METPAAGLQASLPISKRLSAEQLILFEKLMSFLEAHPIRRKAVLSFIYKTTADLIRKAHSKMALIFFKVETCRVLLETWQANTATLALRQQQRTFLIRHATETGTLANIAEGKGVFGNPFGLVERHNMLVRAYKGIQILDRETTGWSSKVVRHVQVETQAAQGLPDEETNPQPDTTGIPIPGASTANKGKGRRKFKKTPSGDSSAPFFRLDSLASSS